MAAPTALAGTTSGASRRITIALACVLLLAAWLRFDGIGFGLDLRSTDGALFTNDVDARGMTLEVLQLLERGDLDPGSFLFRGPAAFLLFATVDAVLVGVQAPFHPGGWHGVVAELRANPSLLHLSHRCLAALAGVLTVALVFRIVRRELDERAALASALILAVAYLHVRHSHFGTVDVLSGLATLGAIDQMLLLIREPRRGRYLASGLLAGAATATKYFGGILGVHLLLAHWMARARAREEGTAQPGPGLLALGVVACPLGFFLAAPTVLLDPGNLVHHVLYDMDELKPGGEGGNTLLENLATHAELTLAIGLGETALLLALLGYWPLWRRGREGRFLVVASLLLTSALFATRVMNLRYGLPFLVSLSIPAGLVLGWIWERMRWPVAAAITAVAIAPSLVRSWTFDQLVKEPDTRIEMFAALRSRGEAAEDVLAVGAPLDLPVPERPTRGPFRYYLGSEAKEDLISHPPRTILVSLATPERAIARWSALDELLRTRYREVLRLEVGEDPGGGARPLCIAYQSPWKQTRPGPALVLYELADGAMPPRQGEDTGEAGAQQRGKRRSR